MLFFDLDGTLTVIDWGTVKPRPGAGTFERAIRRVGFEPLVCVGNAVALIAHLKALGVDPDGPQMIFDLSFGGFEDMSWFRGVCSWIAEPEHRGRIITGLGDWRYVDDLAPRYLEEAEKLALFEAHRGRRSLVPDANGDGQDVLEWLEGIDSCGTS